MTLKTDIPYLGDMEYLDTITWQDFEKIDIRVGTILEAKEFPKAKKPAYQLTIDFGTELGIKRSSAQITKFYSTKNLEGQQIIAVVNFPPKNIAGFISECLVLGVYDENKDVVLLAPKAPVSNGFKIG
jgi:tRNA-binding protein